MNATFIRRQKDRQIYMLKAAATFQPKTPLWEAIQAVARENAPVLAMMDNAGWRPGQLFSVVAAAEIARSRPVTVLYGITVIDPKTGVKLCTV